MLDLCFFFRCDTGFPIFKWSIFFSYLFVYRCICLDQFSFCKVHFKIIQKTLPNKIKAIRPSDRWIWYSILFILIYKKKNKSHVVKSLVFKITREKFEVKKIAILFLCNIFNFSDVRSGCLSHKTKRWWIFFQLFNNEVLKLNVLCSTRNIYYRDLIKENYIT